MENEAGMQSKKNKKKTKQNKKELREMSLLAFILTTGFTGATIKQSLSYLEKININCTRYNTAPSLLTVPVEVKKVSNLLDKFNTQQRYSIITLSFACILRPQTFSERRFTQKSFGRFFFFFCLTNFSENSNFIFPEAMKAKHKMLLLFCKCSRGLGQTWLLDTPRFEGSLQMELPAKKKEKKKKRTT